MTVNGHVSVDTDKRISVTASWGDLVRGNPSDISREKMRFQSL